MNYRINAFILVTLLIVSETVFSLPLQGPRGFFKGMRAYPSMIAHAPKSAGGTVTHLVLDSAVDEDGKREIYAIHYNENGRVESVDITFTMATDTVEEKIFFFYNEHDDADSMHVSLTQDDSISAELHWIFTVPLNGTWASDNFDRMAFGQGYRNYMDFAAMYCPTSGYCMEKDPGSNEWRYYEKDSVISDNQGTLIHLHYLWDNEWSIAEIDTLTISNEHVTVAIQSDRSGSLWRLYRYSYLYDEHGGVIEYNRDSLESLTRSWRPFEKQKYHLTYNDHNHLTSSRMQEWNSFTGTWTSLDSSSFAFHSYTYDDSQNIIVRIDSTKDYWDTAPSITTHYFSYQTFSTPIIHRNVFQKNARQSVTVSSDGKIKLLSAGDRNLFAMLYGLSGRSLCRIPLHADLRLTDYCARNGVHPGSGACLLRIVSGKTGCSLGEWKVLLR
ncbi:MAG: hypothetical protein JW768_16150 [Chitinispirillaceae bacterium]|nr:hypothetical protein [Chitinispirillaceae bacterium]